MADYISIQNTDFDHAFEYNKLRMESRSDGAIVTFTGLVRDFNNDGKVHGLHIEHYPQMTEKSLQKIIDETRARWELGCVSVIHRVGNIASFEQIVFVGVSAKHRKNAFAACEFIMDYLKTSAPFWKQEKSDDGRHWVKSNQKDAEAMTAWRKDR